MKLTVLGPWGAYPKAGEASAGYLLEIADKKILLDCGSGVLSVLQKYIPLHELSAVFISHHHHDHVADLGCLQYARLIDTDLGIRKNELNLFIADDEKASLYKPMIGTNPILIYEKSEVSMGGDVEFSFFKTFHDGHCLGMRIQYNGKVIVYTADTYYNDSLIEYCKDADLLIAETSFYAEYEAKKYGHMNTLEVGKLATEANVKRLVLTHLPHFGNVQQLMDEVKDIFAGEALLAETGLVITL